MISLFLFIIFFLSISLFQISQASQQSSDAILLYEFVSLNYTWDESHKYSDFIQSERFIPENNLLAGINVDRNGDIYLTVPRWRNGVPATLNKLDPISKTLTPYPSWNLQVEGNMDYPNSLQNCQSMTIQSKTHQMWVIEVGRRNFFMNDASLETSTPPGIWIVDLNTNAVVDQYFFPSNIIDAKNSFLNDIALDEERNIAYFSDAWGDGAIIVYHHADRSMYRYSGISTHRDPYYAMVINGVNYGRFIFTTPIDGIALSEDKQAIFYAQVQGTKLHRLPVAVLNNFTLTNSEMDSAVEFIGTKEPSDGIKHINGKLYWGALTTSNYHYITIDSKSTSDMMNETVKSPEEPETMEWIDTFAVDLSTEGKYLYFVSNRLDKYVMNTIDFTGKNGANVRIFKIPV